MRASLLISCGMAMYRCTSGRKLLLMPERQMSQPGSLSRTRLFLLPSSLPTARASPSCLTTSARPCRPTTRRATRCGSRSWTSTGGKGNGHPRSFHSSTKGSTRMQRLDCITIGLGITTRMRGVISAKTR